MKTKTYLSLLLFVLLPVLFSYITISAQTTEFTYQGRLLDSGVAATANYDMRFRLYDDPAAGSQQGSTVTVSGVSVSNGIFTVHLDFGAQFAGSARWLQIGIKPAGSPNPYTDLNPRQPVTSAPYSIRSASAANADLAANSNQLGGIPASGFIQNGTTQQPGTDFNISGNGMAAGVLSGGLVNSSTAFTIGGVYVLSTPGTANTFLGIGSGINNSTGNNGTFVGNNAGFSNTTGFHNSFFGSSAGKSTTTGIGNSFFGSNAGVGNVTGSDNSFFGDGAGFNSTSACCNSFFGFSAGVLNTSGIANSFFGMNAGSGNSTGSNNSYFGYRAGIAATSDHNSFFGASAGAANTTGMWNSFFGSQAGAVNTTGSFNSFFGFNSGNANTTGINNAFFGQGAGFKNTVGQDNTFLGNGAGNSNTAANGNTFVGSLSGVNNTTGVDNTFVGFSAGSSSATVCCNSFFGAGAGQSANAGANAFFGYLAGGATTSGFGNTLIGINAGLTNTTGNNNTTIGSGANVGSANLSNATAIGANAQVSQNNSLVLGGINGINGAISDTNVGIGTTAPQARLHVSGSGILRARVNSDFNTGLLLALSEQPKWSVAASNPGNFQIFNEATGQNALWINTADNNVGIGRNSPLEKLHVSGTGTVRARVNSDSNSGFSIALNETPQWTVAASTSGSGFFQIYNEAAANTAIAINPTNNNVGIDGFSPISNTKLFVNGRIEVGDLSGGGTTQLCKNGANQISICSSSLRYKKDLQPFSRGLTLLNQLKPIAFRWKADNMPDLGFSAEDVAKVEPLLVTHNEKGEIEGVKYDRISTVLVNAVKEQQAEIEAQASQIQQQQKQMDRQTALLQKQQQQIDELKRMVISKVKIRRIARAQRGDK